MWKCYYSHPHLESTTTDILLSWFRVTCQGNKPFLNVNGIDLEVLGYGNLATISTKSKGVDSIVGCGQPMCGDNAGGSGPGCYTQIFGELTSYTVSMKDIKGSCASAFMFGGSYYDNAYPLPLAINSETTHVPATLEWDPNYCGDRGQHFSFSFLYGCNNSGASKLQQHSSQGSSSELLVVPGIDKVRQLFASNEHLVQLESEQGGTGMSGSVPQGVAVEGGSHGQAEEVATEVADDGEIQGGESEHVLLGLDIGNEESQQPPGGAGEDPGRTISVLSDHEQPVDEKE
ncbi:hypothetical protein V6N12_048132 [Hibiscus sabdariffa]|uniref:Uncharacterized protein n=1 Tax=Hibiscus sabdariffa TaxID=183260 RepID=A0ABR2EGD5_9ROSI